MMDENVQHIAKLIKRNANKVIKGLRESNDQLNHPQEDQLALIVRFSKWALRQEMVEDLGEKLAAEADIDLELGAKLVLHELETETGGNVSGIVN